MNNFTAIKKDIQLATKKKAVFDAMRKDNRIVRIKYIYAFRLLD